MILSALNDYYHHMLATPGSRIAPIGFSYEKVSYALVLSTDGRLLDVQDLRDHSGNSPRPSSRCVPQPPKRSVNIAPAFLWDKAGYVLGVTGSSAEKDQKRTEKTHEAFKELHAELLRGTNDEGLAALLMFLSRWDPAQFYSVPLFKDEMLDANFVFRLDAEQAFIHEREAARAIRAQMLEQADSASGLCLVTGEEGPLSQLHPSVKGVRGAQSSGASIVSFNLNAFASYGKHQGENAPVSEKAAFAYTTVLNHLLRGDEGNHQRLQIGDSTTVFWAVVDSPRATESAEMLFSQLLDPPAEDKTETDKVRIAMQKAAYGRPLKLSEINPDLDGKTDMYVLGLAPNASRLSIRFWEVGSLNTFAERLFEHFQDLYLEPCPWKTPPAVRRLALQLATHRKGRDPKPEDIPPNIAGEITRAVLSGRRYPRNLLTTIIMRMRADGHITGLRVALCKGILARDQRLGVKGTKEEVPVSLDITNTDPGYLLGRLFSALENIQKAALGKNLNATIRDRYYGAASATPASIFPVLIRNSQHHLSRLRKDKPGLAQVLEKEVGDIVSGLDTAFPKSFRIESQGKFAIGYYHQNQSRFHRTEETAVEGDES